MLVGGSRFATSPDLTALDEPIHWEPTVDKSKVILKTTETWLRPDEPGLLNFQTLRSGITRQGPDGLHVILGQGPKTVHLFLQGSHLPQSRLSVVTPLDHGARARHRATGRLLDFLEGREMGADSRLTPQKRLRFKSMLRAVDGRSNGTSYREIAESLFGARRVASEPWKTSPLRDTTIRLVRDGLTMVAGGYLDLLRR
ncbi:DUF2285 domain-containing protein [Roseibium sp.]|uniref:DUF2285 domain-containing protein n=1 Tax=Roseibium sp. TaxID=1936156 RepID=UPI0035190914